MHTPVLFLLGYRRCLRLQVAQQSVQHSLIVVGLFPLAEIGNIACAANVTCPTGLALLDSVIQANRKQHEGVPAALFGEGGFHLELDPRTVDGMLREYQQQFVMRSDGLVNAISDLVAGFQVLWRKPAAYSFALQIGIQPFDKLLIFARIANKAGVILDAFADKGTDIFNEGIRQASTTQEYLWNISFRKHKGICTYCRWPPMVHGTQPFDGAQI